MSENSYKYVIVGGGLAGASSVEGIRKLDKTSSILLVGSEKHLPYNRPPLSKKLWFVQGGIEEIFVYDQEFYDQNMVKLSLGTRIEGISTNEKTVVDNAGKSYGYGKLLFATGGTPRSLSIPGSNLEGICYYRYLDDFQRMRKEASKGKSAVVIGGGFIGSEMAAALNINKLNVTMIFPEPYLCNRVFPDYLGRVVQKCFIEHGVKILSGDRPASFARKREKFITQTTNGKQIESDLLIVGIGIAPNIQIAKEAGLMTGNGIIVNEYLQTSNPDIYGAGDIAFSPYRTLGQQMRVEHWDNALNLGKLAGMNMAGANEPLNYMPYFFSDLFELGYEAVGDINGELETFADWQKENDTGIIYYMKDGRIRGIMLCNVSEKVEEARNLILKNEKVKPESLRGAIR